MPETLTQAQIDHYNETGYLILERRIPADVMNTIRGEIGRLCAPARGMTASDDKLDLADSHTPANPRVRRIKLPHKQSRLFDQLMRVCNRAGFTPHIAQEAMQLDIVSLVAAGFGVALVPRSVRAAGRPGVTFKPITGSPHVELFVAWRRGDTSAALRDFLDVLSKVGLQETRPLNSR